MNLSEYATATQCTWNGDGATYREQLDHAAMGLTAELLELHHADAGDTADELGDVYYYAITLAYLLGADFDDQEAWATITGGSVDVCIQLAIGLLDELVKWQHHGRDEYLEEVRDSIDCICGYLDGFCVAAGLQRADVLASNIAKLKARHGASFSGAGKRN